MANNFDTPIQQTISRSLPSSGIVYSTAFSLRDNTHSVIDIIFTAGVSGTFELQFSQDNAFFATYQGSSIATISTDDNHKYVLQNMPGIYWGRIKYTGSAGTSTAFITIYSTRSK